MRVMRHRSGCMIRNAIVSGGKIKMISRERNLFRVRPRIELIYFRPRNLKGGLRRERAGWFSTAHSVY